MSPIWADDLWWQRTLKEAIERVTDSPYFTERERRETLNKLECELRVVERRLHHGLIAPRYSTSASSAASSATSC